MHWHHKNPIPKSLKNTGAFQNWRRRNDTARIAPVSAVLIQCGAIRGHTRQRLKLPVGHILQNRHILLLLQLTVPVAGLVGSLQRHNRGDRRVGAGHGALDRRRELRNLDAVAGNGLDLDRICRGLGVRAAGLVVGIVVAVEAVFLLVILFVFVVVAMVLVVALADLGLSLALPPPFGSVFLQKKERGGKKRKKKNT